LNNEANVEPTRGDLIAGASVVAAAGTNGREKRSNKVDRRAERTPNGGNGVTDSVVGLIEMGQICSGAHCARSRVDILVLGAIHSGDALGEAIRLRSQARSLLRDPATRAARQSLALSVSALAALSLRKSACFLAAIGHTVRG